MHLVQRRQIFLTKAKEADVKAEWANDLSIKATWREIAEMYRELAQLDRPATAERPLPIAKSGHKPVADGKPVPQRVIRIHKRADGTYVGRNEVKAERPLGVDANLSDALMTAKRQAVLDSGRGYRVVIEVQDSGKTWRQVDVVEPPRTR